MPANRNKLTNVESSFRSIAAGANNNLAVSLKKGEVFEFGLNVLNEEIEEERERERLRKMQKGGMA